MSRPKPASVFNPTARRRCDSSTCHERTRTVDPALSKPRRADRAGAGHGGAADEARGSTRTRARHPARDGAEKSFGGRGERPRGRSPHLTFVAATRAASDRGAYSVRSGRCRGFGGSHELSLTASEAISSLASF